MRSLRPVADLMQSAFPARGITGCVTVSNGFSKTHDHGSGVAVRGKRVGDEVLRILFRLCSRVTVTHHHQPVAIGPVVLSSAG